METPSSTRRITRSQTSASSNNIPLSKKKEEIDNTLSKSRKGKSDRSALFDISNDSPIVGLAVGTLETPSSLPKNRGRAKQTPGSGEDLLRGQVKTLLQKVEEEGELLRGVSFHQRPFAPFDGLTNSPAMLLAPTPANTPFLSNLLDESNVTMADEEHGEDCKITQVPDVLKLKTVDSCEDPIPRALLFDSPDKSEASDSPTISISSVLTQEDSCNGEKSLDEDNASNWSLQVNVSSQMDDNDHEDEYDEGCEEAMETIDDLCKGLKKMNMEEKKGVPEFKGRHTRFIYNSDDEVEGEEVVFPISPSILQLKGLPAPEGKHLRFPEEEEED